MTCTILSVFKTVSWTICVRHLSRYCMRSRKTVSPATYSRRKILSRMMIVSVVWIEALAVLVALVMIVGSRLLQLGRARMVITILSARTKVSDFKDDFFMIVLGLF